MAIKPPVKYDPAKIEKLKEYLRIYYTQGNPIDYEILVDGFKAVRRTNNPDMFDMYENFVGGDTISVEILLFTGTSNNNDKHIFLMKEPAHQETQGLNGIGAIDDRIQEHVNKAKRDWDFDLLRKENKELKEEISELEKEIEDLEKEKEQLITSQSPLKGVLGEVGSSMLESFIRRNPKVLASLPGGESLAGLVEEDNRQREKESRQPKANATEVSFTSVTDDVNEEDQKAITFVNQLKQSFTNDEFNRVLLVLQELALHKEKIEETINHLNINQ